MVTPRPLLLVALLGAAFTTSAFAKSDLETINRIRNEGLYHSQVMTTLQHLTDRIGPRLTGSPEMQQASAWTVEQLKAWGLSNVDLEGFEFGRGWSFESAHAKLLHPRKAPLMACRWRGRRAAMASSKPTSSLSMP
jgi:carboxypeptidase Q